MLDSDFVLVADAEAVADGSTWLERLDEETEAQQVTLAGDYAAGTAVLVAPAAFGDLPVYVVRDSAGRLLRIEISPT